MHHRKSVRWRNDYLLTICYNPILVLATSRKLNRGASPHARDHPLNGQLFPVWFKERAQQAEKHFLVFTRRGGEFTIEPQKSKRRR